MTNKRSDRRKTNNTYRYMVKLSRGKGIYCQKLKFLKGNLSERDERERERKSLQRKKNENRATYYISGCLFASKHLSTCVVKESKLNCQIYNTDKKCWKGVQGR